MNMLGAQPLVLLLLSVVGICGGARDTAWLPYSDGHEEAREAMGSVDHLLGFDSQLRKLSQAGAGEVNVLLTAAAAGDLATVQQEIAKGSDLEARSAGITPLTAAVLGKHFEVMKALIAVGADISAKSGDGHQPIHAAALIPKNAEGLTILLDAGADVNAPVGGLFTPIMGAVGMGAKENIELLLSRGASFDKVLVEVGLCSCLGLPSAQQFCNVEGCQNNKAELLALFN